MIKLDNIEKHIEYEYEIEHLKESIYSIKESIRSKGYNIEDNSFKHYYIAINKNNLNLGIYFINKELIENKKCLIIGIYKYNNAYNWSYELYNKNGMKYNFAMLEYIGEIEI